MSQCENQILADFQSSYSGFPIIHNVDHVGILVQLLMGINCEWLQVE